MIRIATAARIGAAIKIPEYWALTVVTTAVNQDYTVDINAGITPNIKIDWGDGNVETFNTIGLKTKVYANAGTYVIKLSGSFASGGNIRFGSNADNRARLKSTSSAPYIPGLLNFYATFQSCTGLTGSIPADLFRYNINVSTDGFYQTFYNCNKLELSPWIFFAEGEEGTRFLNRPSNFFECFRLTGAYGGSVAGTAPALWNCNFGTATPVTTDTFQGHSAASLTNWADIPAAWT